eukprot:98282-Chlamydomonas_euryale.AAC.1
MTAGAAEAAAAAAVPDWERAVWAEEALAASHALGRWRELRSGVSRMLGVEEDEDDQGSNWDGGGSGGGAGRGNDSVAIALLSGGNATLHLVVPFMQVSPVVASPKAGEPCSRSPNEYPQTVPLANVSAPAPPKRCPRNNVSAPAQSGGSLAVCGPLLLPAQCAPSMQV